MISGLYRLTGDGRPVYFLKLDCMGINIIKKENLVEVVSIGTSKSGDVMKTHKFSYSDFSLMLEHGDSHDVVEIRIKNEPTYRVKLSEVTVQSGSDGTPVQADLGNWDALTDDG